MTISTTVLNKTEESARALASEVVKTTLDLQEATAQHRAARAAQEKPAVELNELIDFLNDQGHQGRHDWSAHLWGSIYDRLSTLELLDAGVLGAHAEQELEALANPPAPALGTPESPIMVIVNDHAYPTVLDGQGQQRFVRNEVIAQLFTLAENNGVINLDQLGSMARNGHYSDQDYQAFMIMGLGLTVQQFIGHFPTLQVTNPLWDDQGAAANLV